MNHRRMEFILIIWANDKNLNDVERSEIIERTIDIYLKKQRRKMKHSEIEATSKIALLETEVDNNQCVENSATSVENSEDFDMFYNSNHNPFDAENEDD